MIILLFFTIGCFYLVKVNQLKQFKSLFLTLSLTSVSFLILQTSFLNSFLRFKLGDVSLWSEKIILIVSLTLGYLLVYSWSQNKLIALQRYKERQFFSLPMVVFPLSLTLLTLIQAINLSSTTRALLESANKSASMSLFWNKPYFIICIAGLFLGATLGFVFKNLFKLPNGFKHEVEVENIKKYLKNKNQFHLLNQTLVRNPAHLFSMRELLNVVLNSQKENEVGQVDSGINEILSSYNGLKLSLFYWAKQDFLNSFHPMVEKINQLNFKSLNKYYYFLDLNDQDLDCIYNLFKAGSWKMGLFLMDQYLKNNKQSKQYTSALIFADRYLQDLKKISFDEETIETWLLQYSEYFKGSPISQKISMMFYNKEDWFSDSNEKRVTSLAL